MLYQPRPDYPIEYTPPTGSGDSEDEEPPELEPGSPVGVSSVVLAVMGSGVGSSVVPLGSEDVEPSVPELSPPSSPPLSQAAREQTRKPIRSERCIRGRYQGPARRGRRV